MAIAYPETFRRAGNAQGALLVIISIASVAATALLAPIVPKMAAEFASVDSGATQKAVLALSIPALVVAIMAPILGRVVDKIGRKAMIIGPLLVYGLVGMAPAFLKSLDMIIVSRLILGFAEAALMTTATTMIGDYYKGSEREKWLVLQASVAAIAAVLFFAVSGAIGEENWRNTYLLYGIALVAVPLAYWLLWEPEKTAEEHKVAAEAFPWRRVWWLYGVAFVGSLIFFIPAIQIPFLLTERGVPSPQTIGLTTAIGALAVPVGSTFFKLRSEKIFWHNLAFTFALMALGLALMVWGPGYGAFLVGVVVANLGCGFYMPLLITAIMAHLHFDQRGTGTGFWQTAVFLGNFLSPMIVLIIAATQNDKVSAAVAAFAALALFAVILCLVARPRNTSARTGQ